MDEKRHEQIRTNFLNYETDYLLDIWQNGDADDWEKEVIEIIGEILRNRLGYLPPLSINKQVTQALIRVDNLLEREEYDNALSECEVAIQLDPNSAIAYNHLGNVYAEARQLEKAMNFFRKAIELDPDLKDTWKKFLLVEQQLEEIFTDSKAKRYLDNALDFAYSNQPEKALVECELAKPLMPDISIAYNYLGLILHTLENFGLAIESYQKAIQLNPRFSPARENLADARRMAEELHYFGFSEPGPADEEETIIDYIGTEYQESEDLVPQWLFMDKSAYYLVGWPGHRTRYGRSGYDPLEQDFEFAHMEGVMFRLLLDRKFRTRNPFYLMLMAFFGVTFFFLGILPFFIEDPIGIIIGLLCIAYTIVGALLLVNVFLSLLSKFSKKDEDNDLIFY